MTSEHQARVWHEGSLYITAKRETQLKAQAIALPANFKLRDAHSPTLCLVWVGGLAHDPKLCPAGVDEGLWYGMG